MKKEQDASRQDNQDVARIISHHLDTSRRRRKAARRFAKDYLGNLSNRKNRRFVISYLSPAVVERPGDSPLAQNHLEALELLRQKLDAESAKKAGVDEVFSATKRTVLIMRSKLAPMSQNERVLMYRDAGYSESDISKITRKKMLATAALTTGLSAAAETVRAGGVLYDEAIPYLDRIPSKYASLAAVLSIGGYIASFKAFISENLKITKERGASANSAVTGLYFLGDKLFPNRIRDRIAVWTPVLYDSLYHGAAYSAGIVALSGDPKKIIAGNVLSIGFNTALKYGTRLWRKWGEGKNI